MRPYAWPGVVEATGVGRMTYEECHIIARRDGQQDRLHLVTYHADGRLIASQPLPFLATPFAWEQIRHYLERQGWVCTADQHQHPVPSLVFRRQVPGTGVTVAPELCQSRPN